MGGVGLPLTTSALFSMLQPSIKLSHHLSPIFDPSSASTIVPDNVVLSSHNMSLPHHISQPIDNCSSSRIPPFATGVFHCRICSYTTRLKKNLKLHMRTHSGERPYACPYCPYRAAQQQNLEKHVWTHTGERPFPCLHCPDQFRQKHHLARHVRTQHSKPDPIS